jgi:hypothetical protein
VPSKEQILLSAIRGIQALAYDTRAPAGKLLDRIRMTCHQVLIKVEDV